MPNVAIRQGGTTDGLLIGYAYWSPIIGAFLGMDAAVTTLWNSQVARALAAQKALAKKTAEQAKMAPMYYNLPRADTWDSCNICNTEDNDHILVTTKDMGKVDVVQCRRCKRLMRPRV